MRRPAPHRRPFLATFIAANCLFNPFGTQGATTVCYTRGLSFFAQAGPKRVYELLEAAKFEVSPPLFRVQVEGQWHTFEIRGNKIHGVN